MRRTTAVARSDGSSTRDVILDAAERRFADRGFTGVSVRKIAADAGLKNQASLYNHFRADAAADSRHSADSDLKGAKALLAEL